MEDFLKFLLIAGVILVGIFKEVNKNKSKKTKENRPVPQTPPTVEIDPDAVPLPEAWGRSRTLEDIFQPQTYEQPAPKPAPKPAAKPKRKKEEISVSASLASSAAQDEKNSRQGSHYNTPHESDDNKEDFGIHSAEEARKAIIWGEILQRKY
ncbi:ferrichrome ABC transporter substrate-binding protein [uncultured Bacteroides sp.]|uniref:ferrichrome ABC transporter substrate-binding protein n=1 Tax=uncultured Bacteroides sp. TaxID=162156 RepID=UPI0025CFF5ED|nr:ferrichrome ABC transporter substrate-binding protein [uncultured Bacteroides sp.]